MSTVCLHGTRVVGVLPGWQMNVNVNVNDVNSNSNMFCQRKSKAPRCERDQSSHPKDPSKRVLAEIAPQEECTSRGLYS